MGFLRIKNSQSFLACTRRYSVKSEFNLSEVVHGFRYSIMCDDNLNNENLHLMLSLGPFVPSEEVSC